MRRPWKLPKHRCHWPGCEKVVPPKLWGCLEHWMTLPKELRDEVWAAYRHGQEEDRDISMAYLAVARKIRNWIQDREVQDYLTRSRIPKEVWDTIQEAE